MEEESVEGLSLAELPDTAKVSIQFVISLLDIIVQGYPQKRLLGAPQGSPAQSIETLKEEDEDTTIWVATPSDDYSTSQTPIAPGMSEHDAKSITYMRLYWNTCDRAAIIARLILGKLIGNEWLVRRIVIMPRRKHIYVEGRPGSLTNSYTAATKLPHTIIGLFDPKGYDPELPKGPTGCLPQYVVDPTILQYCEKNSRRFSTWKEYETFVKPFEDSGDQYDDESQEEDEETSQMVGAYWVSALNMVRSWIAQGKINPQFSATKEKSLEGIDFSGCPPEVQISVSFILRLLDIYTYNFPRPMLEQQPARQEAKDIDVLRDLPGEPIVWVARESGKYDGHQFPPGTPEDIMQMGLYRNVCDHTTILAKKVLRRLIGTKWHVCRINLFPVMKNIYIAHRGSGHVDYGGYNVSPYPKYKGCAHAAIGLFPLDIDWEKPLPSDLMPEYIIDPTVLQYGEPNSMRFGNWIQYMDFAQRYWEFLSDKDDDDVEAKDIFKSEWYYWKVAELFIIEEQLQEGTFNINTITDSDMEVMLDEANLRMADVAPQSLKL
ncbi:hypothetical protein BDV96DRAFT_650291 [Lophiotrema nucula]|uniref:Uncharacterized protein n=1 Tax=Lophiotrema nucula TaxID=690887 RepID=A0A6A5YVN6_9PLEO|nr:hypothetical protein BDV96DRAFT_650291 [Lophiotrema nucula]